MAKPQTLERAGEPSICWHLHPASGEPRASVLITHGYADHQARYEHVWPRWTNRNLSVATWDLRGHGDSQGPRGHVVSFSDYVRDLSALLDRLEQEPAWKAGGKPVLFGHSLGGLIVFHAALAHPDRVRGLGLSAPFFELAMRVPLYKRVPAKLLSKLVPRLSMPSGLSGKEVTSNERVAREYDNDPKVFKTATARWFTETLHAQQQAMERASDYRLPIAALLAGHDLVVNTEATRQLLGRVSSSVRDVELVEGAWHEIFNELEGDRWIDWMADRMLQWA